MSRVEGSARVTVWSDYVCPFCYLELPVLRRLAQELGERLEVEWRAFELRPEPVPTLDPDGAYLDDVWTRAVRPMAEERAMEIRRPPIQPRSRRALETAELARDRGVFDRVHEALFRAFFLEGRDLADPGVLVEVGGDAGPLRCWRPAGDAVSGRQPGGRSIFGQRVGPEDPVRRVSRPPDPSPVAARVRSGES